MAREVKLANNEAWCATWTRSGIASRLLLGRFPLQWLAHPGEHLRFWTHVDFLWWANCLGYRVQTAIPYQGTPFLKRLWPNLFASGIVYVLEFKE